MESTLRSINSSVESLTPGPDLDICLVWQLEEEVGRINTEHSDLTRDILSLEHEDGDLLGLSSAFSKTLFDLSVRIKRLLRDQTAPPSTKEAKSGIKLPKMNVPTFNGNILKWNTFWQQFDVAIHSKTQLKDAENLAYRRDALKDGPTRNVVEGLSQDADYYKEAIRCLQRCYDRPHLIHQEHVRAIYEAPSDL